MTLELLVIKSDDDYIRHKAGRYRSGGLEKASVFPLAALTEVRGHVAALRGDGWPGVHLKKLIVKEEPYSGT